MPQAFPSFHPRKRSMTEHLTRWVGEHLDVTLVDPPGADGIKLGDLAGLAVRRNPKRAHLVVSKVLGKHIPTEPRLSVVAPDPRRPAWGRRRLD
jgi:hypothetical protein